VQLVELPVRRQEVCPTHGFIEIHGAVVANNLEPCFRRGRIPKRVGRGQRKMGHLTRAENTGDVALDGADRIEVINEVGCSPSGLELDPSPPMQVELVGCMLSVRKIDSDGEMLQLSREEADLTRYLS